MSTKALSEGGGVVHKGKDLNCSRSSSSIRSIQRSKPVHRSIHTQTPKNELSYELDKALYTFKENVKKTVPIKQQYINQKVRQHFKVYLPTIIDTKPRTRRDRTHIDTNPKKDAVSPTKRVPKSLLPLCSCDFRPSRAPSNARPHLHRSVHQSNSSPSIPDTATRKRHGPKLCDITPDIHAPSDMASEGRVTSLSTVMTSPKDCDEHVTPVLAIAIRRNAQDKAPIVQFNGIITNANKMNFIPFTRHISTQTYKSNVHVEFELNEPAQ